MPWTLEHNNTTYALDELALSKPVFEFNNGASDHCRIHKMDTSIHETPFMSYGEDVVIKRNGSRWFSGTVCALPLEGKAESESTGYIISGPWHQLEQLVFQQDWQFAIDPNDPESATAPQNLSRVILGQDLQGNKIPLQAQVQEILNYAVSAGVSLNIGTLDLPLSVPWEEYADLTCAEAIRELLKWAPDAVSWFDYSTNPPTFNIKRASGLITRSFKIPDKSAPSAQDAPIESVRLNPRYDLQVSEVYIRYLFENRSNDTIWRTVEVDAYPAGATGQAGGALCKSFELRGSEYRYSRTVLKQEVETVSLGDINELDFWRNYFPELKDVDPTKISVSNAERIGHDLSLDQILTKGSITDWMEEQHNLKAEKQRVRCRVGPFNRVISGYETEDVIFYDLETELTMTDASSKTYRYQKTSTSTSIAAEPTPVGLAQSLYEILHPLPWEGELLLLEQDVSGQARPGMQVRLTGGRSEWESMQAIVQRVEEDANTGRTKINLGVSRRADADGMLALLRVDQNPRKRKTVSSRAIARAGGGDADDEDQGLGKYHPSTPGSIPSIPQYRRFVVQDPQADVNDPARVLVIDTQDIIDTVSANEDIVCQLREIPVAAVDVNGNIVLRYAAAVISNPYTKA